MGSPLPRQPRIAILGAGPAGLSTAWFLKQRGYEDVTVFEKLGRVGGLVESMTSQYKSFDLGANYVMPGYRETLKLARHVGARTFKAKTYEEARVDPRGRIEYRSISDYVREDPQGNPISTWRLAKAVFRYMRARHRARQWIDRPDFGTVHQNPDLCVSFENWIDANDLGDLKRMFTIPITMMGYGFLDQIAAPYALKFLSLPNFLTLVARGIPGVGSVFPFPRRFVRGFQRMWEQLSWQLDVRKNITVTEVTRTPSAKHPIRIEFTHPEQIFNEQQRFAETLYFDQLIVACPLMKEVLKEFLTLSNSEDGLFGQVEAYPFCHTTLHVVKQGTDEPFELHSSVLCCTPFDRNTIGKPWAAAQIYPEDSNLVQFYTRVVPESPNDPDGGMFRESRDWATALETTRASHPHLTQKELEDAAFRACVFRNIKKLLDRMGAAAAGDDDVEDTRWRGYNQWLYFGHVDAKAFAQGFYAALEDIQGQNDTWYVGGVTNFELIEPIVRYAKALAGRIDAKVQP